MFNRSAGGELVRLHALDFADHVRAGQVPLVAGLGQRLFELRVGHVVGEVIDSLTFIGILEELSWWHLGLLKTRVPVIFSAKVFRRAHYLAGFLSVADGFADLLVYGKSRAARGSEIRVAVQDVPPESSTRVAAYAEIHSWRLGF